MNNRYCIVFDYETDGLDTDTLNVTQIGAIPIDLYKLEVLKDDFFNIDVKPNADIHSTEYMQANGKTVDFHCKHMNCTREEVLARWDAGHSYKDAFKMFADYLKKFKNPVCGGQNIIKFDCPITKRYCKQLDMQYPFANSGEIDLLYISDPWYMFSKKPPFRRSLDAQRKHFGIETEGGHDALKDVIDCSELIIRFLTLNKTFITKCKSLYEGTPANA